MADNDKMIGLELARGVNLQPVPDHPEYSALMFKTDDGINGAVLDGERMARLVALLLNNICQRSGEDIVPDPREMLTATPILASHLGFGKGRTETEALLSFQVGNVCLTFSVDVSMLVGICETLRPNIRQVEAKKPN